ncbi:MAG: hypothetical protein K8F91_02985 [Candidatus Obscuribacterales bacterium]|nr:hypothetical protein [Candidatus Obscuribacterales bacterium]
MKLAKFYYRATLIVCSANFFDTVRNAISDAKEPDALWIITGAVANLWLIAAVIVLVESIRQERVIKGTIFYVTTMTVLLFSTPALPSQRIGHMLEAAIMLSNIIVHLVLLLRLDRMQTPAEDDVSASIELE